METNNPLSQSSRRLFFKSAATTAASIIAAKEFLAPQASAAVAPTNDTQFATPNEFLRLNAGEPALVTEVVGGVPYLQVLESDEGGVVRKEVGSVAYEPLKVRVPGAIPPALQVVVTKFLDRTQGEGGISGEVIHADANLAEVGILEFSEALMTELVVPRLDAASKERADFEYTFNLGFSRRRAGTQRKFAAPRKSAGTALAGNFRLSISGLESVSQFIATVEPISIARPVTYDGPYPYFGMMNVSDLVVSVVESRSKPFYSWFQETIAGDRTERTATLELLAPDMKKVLLRLELRNLGLWSLSVPEGQRETVRRVTASMYCEEVRLISLLPA